MKDLLSVTRHFNLEVLVCLVVLLSMAVGIICIGTHRLAVAMLSSIKFSRHGRRRADPRHLNEPILTICGATDIRYDDRIEAI